MQTVMVDDIKYDLSGNFTVYQFCFNQGIIIPCFCYHEKLTIVGNCRICLVEVNSNLSISCALPLVDEMTVYTNNDRVKESREGILEFLLINHPLDCPICDQAGECDLQDISLAYGTDRGRFYEEYKKSVSNSGLSEPFIKTVMTRCIHCTRCTRFLTEITGTYDLGVLGRGSFMEIGTFIDNNFYSELSGNIIDLCPVGALTSMPYAFSVRPWEICSVDGIDVMDSLASSIRLDTVNNLIVRILPRLDENVNEE
jgi:NADH dehydrogenase/NADH:ubiquinone oxidoreductase subunit G